MQDDFRTRHPSHDCAKLQGRAAIIICINATTRPGYRALIATACRHGAAADD